MDVKFNPLYLLDVSSVKFKNLKEHYNSYVLFNFLSRPLEDMH